MTQTFEHVYMRTLRQLLDAENQLAVSLSALKSDRISGDFLQAIAHIETESRLQAGRLEEVFRVLYHEPRSEASWVATALLREAWESVVSSQDEGGTEACAAALLALKRYELTLYEALLRWSERCDLHEVIPSIRKSIAEELVQASVLSSFAFRTMSDMRPVTTSAAVH